MVVTLAEVEGADGVPEDLVQDPEEGDPLLEEHCGVVCGAGSPD